MRVSNFFALVALICSNLFLTTPAIAGPYASSAHGSTGGSGYGVQRLGSDYVKGNCSHCHEQHASVGGSEPAPVSGASNFTLFSTLYTSDTDNFCVDCHDNTTTVATTAITNHSYSYRAGNLTTDFVSSIMDSFDTSSMNSTHNLNDMRTFLRGTTWGYSTTAANIQPCEGCHNPHAVQGDPANSPSGRKSSTARGYPLSRPSDYQAATGWELWGDGSGEKMSDYAGTQTYQAPYYGGSTTTYEPEGNTTSDGSNLADINTFCTDCHNSTTSITSSNLGTVQTFDWANEAHGLKGATDNTGKTEMIAPYTETGQGQYVLACTDCHEPHGSTNIMLIRTSVNGGTVSLPSGTSDWRSLCVRCHEAGRNMKTFHHAVRGSYSGCSVCHPVSDKSVITDCTTCHHHNAAHPTVPAYNMF